LFVHETTHVEIFLINDNNKVQEIRIVLDLHQSEVAKSVSDIETGDDPGALCVHN